jgi:hypothetical protein
MAHPLINRILGKRVRPPTEEETTDPYFAFVYIHDVAKGRVPACEKALASDPEFAYNYAYIINDRFPEGEPVIATSGPWSLSYAMGVLKGPFPAGERAILDSDRKSAYLAFLDKKGIDLAEHFRDRIVRGEITLEEIYGA